MRKNEDTIMQNFSALLASKLHYCRKEMNLTQQKLSTLANVERSCISHYESGKVTPPVPNLLSFSKIFNVDLNDLLNPELNMECFETKYPESHFIKMNSAH